MSSFESVPAPERRAEVTETLRAKLESAERFARVELAAENAPARLTERVTENG